MMTQSSPDLRIVHTESSVGWGGQEVRILTESQGMMARGHDVRIVCNPESMILKRAADYGVPAEGLPIRKKKFASLSAARHWLSNNQADIINTHSSTDSWLFTLAARSMRNRPKIVRTRHLGAPVPNNPASNWLYGKGADRLVTCGSIMRQNLIERNGVQPDRTVSVPTGIDIERFSPGSKQEARERLALPQKRFIVGIVAALRREKGHEILCQAAKRLTDCDFDLLIVGDGLSRDLLRGWVAENGLTERTHFAGNQTNVVPWLHAMDLFVLPSWGIEGVPQSIMQAMSCQLPVVSTTVGSISEAVDDGQTGLLVPPSDPDALAVALREMMQNETKREQFAAAGREKAIRQFPVSRMLDRMEQTFYDALDPAHSMQKAA